jgi:hypothetical protein
MPIYIPVYKRRLDSEGQPMYDTDGLQIMDQVDTIVVPDPPVYEMTAEDIAMMEAEMAQQSQQTQEPPITEDPIENP